MGGGGIGGAGARGGGGGEAGEGRRGARPLSPFSAPAPRCLGFGSSLAPTVPRPTRPFLVSRRPRLPALRRASGCSLRLAPSPCFFTRGPLRSPGPSPGPALALQALPWTLSSPSALTLPPLPGLEAFPLHSHRLAKSFPGAPSLPQEPVCFPSCPLVLRPFPCTLTAYPGPSLEPRLFPQGRSTLLPGSLGLPHPCLLFQALYWTP